MHVVIRQYPRAEVTNEELARFGRRLASSLSRSRGFVSCVLLEAETGDFATISIFEDRIGLEEAERLIEASLLEPSEPLQSGARQVITGEIVFQRGL